MRKLFAFALIALMALPLLGGVTFNVVVTDNVRWFRTTSLPAYNSPMSFAMWVNVHNVATGQIQAFYTAVSTTGGFNIWKVGGSSASPPLFSMFISGVTSGVGSAISADTWYFVGASSNGTGTANLYLNGSLTAEATMSGTPSATDGPATIDLGNGATSNDCICTVAAVKIWTATLTAAELAREMRHYRPMRTANLYYWSKAMAVGQHTPDYSGNGNNFSVTGASPTDADGPPVGW